MQHLRKNPNATQLAFLCLLLTAGCGSNVTVTTNQQGVRDYTKEVSYQGKGLLSVTCNYHGNTPADPESYQGPIDYRSKDPNFYRISFYNRSQYPIEITGVEYRMKIGRIRGKSSHSALDVKNSWGSNIIPAQDTLTREDSPVWAVKSGNILYKTYSFKTTAPDTGSFPFEVEVPLLYQR